MAAGVFDPVADGGPAGDSGVGRGFSRVENRVGLFVAELARLALDPNHVATGVDHHVLISRRTSDADPHEVLAAPLVHTGDHIGAEVVDFVLGTGRNGFPGDAAENGGDSVCVSAHTGVETVVVVTVRNRRESIAVEETESVFRPIGGVEIGEGSGAGDGERL